MPQLLSTLRLFGRYDLMKSALDCYYCKGLRGTRDRADVHRYVREGVGAILR